MVLGRILVTISTGYIQRLPQVCSMSYGYNSPGYLNPSLKKIFGSFGRDHGGARRVLRGTVPMPC